MAYDEVAKAEAWCVLARPAYLRILITVSLVRAMVEGSPKLAERKRGHIGDYVARTVGKALAMAGQGRDA